MRSKVSWGFHLLASGSSLSPLKFALSANSTGKQMARLKKEFADSRTDGNGSRADLSWIRPTSAQERSTVWANSQKAADRYCRVNNLPLGSRLDVSGISAPYRQYTVTDEDLKWIGPQAAEPAEQETLKAMLYADLWELVAERFHCDLDFLRELNPKVSNVGVGTVFRVPDVSGIPNYRSRRAREAAPGRESSRSRARRRKMAIQKPHFRRPRLPTASRPRQLSADPATRRGTLARRATRRTLRGDRLIACFPCTPGSRDVPVPTGQWKVTANVLMP
jgi:hypothetical protein